MTPVPSCTLMFKKELPLMFPDDPDVKAVAEAMFDPFEYLVLRHRDGLLKTDFKTALGSGFLSRAVPSAGAEHRAEDARAARDGPRHEGPHGRALLGHDGTWGVKSEYFENSMKIGRPVFRQMGEGEPGYVSFGLPDRRAPHHAGNRRNEGRAAASDHAAAYCLWPVEA